MTHRVTKKRSTRTLREMVVVPILLLLLLLTIGAFIGCSGCRTAAIRPNQKNFHPPRQVQMTVTGYCNCQKCCGWHYNWHFSPRYAYGRNKGKPKKVGVTASGTHARPGTVAADTSRYPMGTIVHVPGYGYGRVEDVGGAIKGNSLDLWFPSHKRALQWGRQKLTVKVWLPR